MKKILKYSNHFFALNKVDYQEAFQKAINAGAQSDSLIQKLATRFFNDLAYGNRIPKLQYEGTKFNLNTYDVPALVNSYTTQNTLATLPTYFLSNSLEVATILDSLHYYQDSAHLNKDKVALLVKAANEFRW